MIIKAMTPEHSQDWFDFFDHRAFADHPDWKGCYCTGFFMPRMEGYEGRTPRRREYAQWLVEKGLMKGYLAYEGGKAIAWCNVNLKSAFPGLLDVSDGSDKVLSIACFIVQKEYRGKGIAQKMLYRIIKDAEEGGIEIIEAYPRKRAKTEYGMYHGAFSMYEKNGFSETSIHGKAVARRYLS